jgi:N-acetyl-gamma-glutamyl-phosphate reductase
MIKAGIVGGTGYTGAELLRLLVAHPEVEVVTITSRSADGQRVDEVLPNLRSRTHLTFSRPSVERLKECDVVFFATPHGTAMRSAAETLAAGVRVIDLSADFRLRDPVRWQQWYGEPHCCPEILSKSVYGLPEIFRDAIRSAELVANPGCYPTAVLLGLLPLVEGRVVDTSHLIASASSGVSGAGRKAQINTLLCEVAENYRAYGLTGHRHSPEIEQILAQSAGEDVRLTFVPHLIPMIRGLHATLFARLHHDTIDLQALFEARYAGEVCVEVLPPGSHPDTRSLRGTNRCRIAVHRPTGRDVVVVLTAIDNLVKGAAGQAVQNMNLMFGLDEALGLNDIALFP